MTVLDFEKSETLGFDYSTVQTVWGGEVDIEVAFDNEKGTDPINKEQCELRKIPRLLGEKLRFVEGNRAAIEEAIMSADIEDIEKASIRDLHIDWLLFTYFVDTGGCELFVYANPDSRFFDDGSICVTVHNDNSLEVEDVSG